ncbi:MAG TPA: prolyl oligopeptidase family serine peptidase [Thermoanaerobaculia bacterium]|nr:prolyl oligopeptidase family serine peptidase [Thermoanaerobaculia bacterium]
MTPRPLAATAVLALLATPALFAAASTFEPGENLTAEGVPPIPIEVAERVLPYTEIRSAAFRGWHPERREMVVATRFGETNQIHRVERPRGARRQLTFFREPVGSATYDPRDGGSLVLSRDRGGDEFHQLYRYDLHSGASVLLTDGEKRHAAGPWSNASDQLAFVKVAADADGAFTEIWVLDPRRPDAKRRIATLRGGGWSVADWSPEDDALLLVERVSANQSSLWLLQLVSGQPRRLSPDPGRTDVAWGAGHFSAEGEIVFTTTDLSGEHRQLAALRLADGAVEVLSTDLPWSVTDVELSEQGTTLAFLTNEGGWSRLYLLDTASRERREITALPGGVASGLRWHRNGNDLALTLSSARVSGDVYVVDASTGSVERWTESETGGLDAQRFVEPTDISWTSFDGRRITGLLHSPDWRRFPGQRPVIIDIHGGPEGQARPSFRGTDNVWISELGIAVIYPNVRGSSGYGKTFLRLDDGPLREGSYEDIRTLLDWIAANPHLDAGRVMVTGGSYGGHMTFAVAARYSDRIRCSIPVVGISNLRTFLENTQGYRRDLRRVEYGDERDPQMREFLERIAPLNRAGDIGKPIFIVHGRNDPRVPVSESEQIVGEVRANGVPAWYLVAENEGHGFRRKSNRSFQLYATVLFVERFLLGDAEATGSSAAD